MALVIRKIDGRNKHKETIHKWSRDAPRPREQRTKSEEDIQNLTTFNERKRDIG